MFVLAQERELIHGLIPPPSPKSLAKHTLEIVLVCFGGGVQFFAVKIFKSLEGLSLLELLYKLPLSISITFCHGNNDRLALMYCGKTLFLLIL